MFTYERFLCMNYRGKLRQEWTTLSEVLKDVIINSVSRCLRGYTRRSIDLPLGFGHWTYYTKFIFHLIFNYE